MMLDVDIPHLHSNCLQKNSAIQRRLTLGQILIASDIQPSLLGARASLLGAPGIATTSKDATRGKGHRY